jgi:hypothetical protein
MAQMKTQNVGISSQTESPKIMDGIHTRTELKNNTLEFSLGRE